MDQSQNYKSNNQEIFSQSDIYFSTYVTLYVLNMYDVYWFIRTFFYIRVTILPFKLYLLLPIHNE